MHFQPVAQRFVLVRIREEQAAHAPSFASPSDDFGSSPKTRASVAWIFFSIRAISSRLALTSACLGFEFGDDGVPGSDGEQPEGNSLVTYSLNVPATPTTLLIFIYAKT
jgi:hypothetical protein